MLRKVVAPPGFKGYRPFGSPEREEGCVELLYEEYEALKLADYEMMNHQEASRLMGISRPTFARIYESARQKIAKALVETREIRTVYGNAWMDGNWFLCVSCQARFTMPVTVNEKACPLCRSERIESVK